MKPHMRKFTNLLLVVAGVVLIWRGIWYLLDGIDELLFGGSYLPTAVVGIVVGLLFIWLPDGEFDELGKR